MTVAGPATLNEFARDRCGGVRAGVVDLLPALAVGTGGVEAWWRAVGCGAECVRGSWTDADEAGATAAARGGGAGDCEPAGSTDFACVVAATTAWWMAAADTAVLLGTVVRVAGVEVLAGVDDRDLAAGAAAALAVELAVGLLATAGAAGFFAAAAVAVPAGFDVGLGCWG
jgi:hypothetical protein